MFSVYPVDAVDAESSQSHKEPGMLRDVLCQQECQNWMNELQNGFCTCFLWLIHEFMSDLG